MKGFLQIGLAALVLAARAAASPAADGAEPWLDAPAFETTPAALLAATAKLDAPDAAAEVLLEDVTFAVDDANRAKHTYHSIYRVLNAAGVDERSSVSVAWSPWRQARPSIRARVVSADGAVHELDPATIAEAPLGGDDSDVYSDRRVLQAPLPAVAPGSVVELLWIVEDTAPSFEAGTAGGFVFGDSVPVRHTTFAVLAPASLPLALTARNLDSVTPVRDERDGRVSITYAAGPIPKLKPMAEFAPYDAHQLSAVAFATGGSWARVASSYGAVVDRQVAAAKLGPEFGAVLRGVEGRIPRLEALVRQLHKKVRYTGIEFGESSIVPARPEETLKRRFGDCKDKSALLVAMLRAVGFDAHVALLSVGFGPDVPAELPTIDFFDHAVVVVAGDPPMWIDATAEYLRVGDLPPSVAGRLALIASSSATALVRIPEARGGRNRMETVREWYLTERGRGRVVQTIHPEGEIEGEYRSYYAGLSDSEVHRNLEVFAKSNLKGASLGGVTRVAANDFEKPFTVTLEAKETEVGETMSDASTVRFPPSDFVQRLEESLPPEDPPADGAADPDKRPRVLPFRLNQAFVDVWTVRVHPPPRFVPGESANVEDTRVGPVHFTRTYEVAPDGSAVFRATVDTGDRLVWTVGELAEVRAWIAKVKASESVQLVFEQAGYKALRAGKIQDAIREYRTLVELHPAEALHHCQLADAYLQGGVGEAARSEARRGVALEPASAEAWRVLGWVNLNDVLARPFMKGSDLPEAERAYRKAMELEPKDDLARRNLGVLLEYDPKSMVRYGLGARLGEAIDVWRALRKDLDSKAHDATLMVTLARAERWQELRDFAREAAGAETRGAWLVVSTAVLSGTDDAIAEAGRQTTSRSALDQLLLAAAGTLVQTRRYAEAAVLLRAGAQAAQQGAATANAQADLFARCRRHEDISLEGDTPDALTRRFMVDLVSGAEPQSLARYFSPRSDGKARSGDEFETVRNRLDVMRGGLAAAGLSPDGLADLVLAISEIRTEGDDENGYKTAIKIQAPGQTQGFDLFIRREGGVLRLVGTNGAPDSLGSVALTCLEEGHAEQARRWLVWAHDALPPAHADLLADAPFMAFWPPDAAGGDDGIRLAAAALAASGSGADKGLPILVAAAGRSTTKDESIRIDHALNYAYGSLHRGAEAIEPCRRLRAALPNSDIAWDRLVASLLNDLRFDEVTALADERAKASPDDVRVWRTRARVASYQRKWEDAAKAWRHVIELGKGEEDDYNGLAWEALFRVDRSQETVEAAERAALFRKSPSWALLHTLAAVYADAGRVTEARQTLIKELEARGISEPGSQEWLIIGRLAEQYGANEQAVAAYQRVKKPEGKGALAGSGYELAQQWMAGLAPPESGPKAQPTAKSGRGARGRRWRNTTGNAAVRLDGLSVTP